MKEAGPHSINSMDLLPQITSTSTSRITRNSCDVSLKIFECLAHANSPLIWICWLVGRRCFVNIIFMGPAPTSQDAAAALKGCVWMRPRSLSDVISHRRDVWLPEGWGYQFGGGSWVIERFIPKIFNFTLGKAVLRTHNEYNKRKGYTYQLFSLNGTLYIYRFR